MEGQAYNWSARLYTSQQKSRKCSLQAADLREKLGTIANSSQSSDIEHNKPTRRVVGNRAPECSSKSSKRRIPQGDMNVSCQKADKGIDERALAEPLSEVISSAEDRSLQSDEYFCEHFDDKIERTFCAHCDLRIWSLRCGMDHEQGWLHPSVFLDLCPSARGTPPGIVAQFVMLSPSPQCHTLQILNNAHRYRFLFSMTSARSLGQSALHIAHCPGSP